MNYYEILKISKDADEREIKSAYKLISPNEALEIINKPLEPVEVDKEKVVVFGDIHGCYEPLKEYFDKNPFDENTCYIFCGDYTDRGIQNKEVLEFLFSIYKNKNVILLEGNHEKWLRIYASKEYDISNYLADKKIKYKDVYITKIIGEYTMQVLKDVDEVAYVRFASVYKQFKDIHSFLEELNKLISEK